MAVEDMVYLSTLDGTVRAVRADTGEASWSRQMGATSAPWVYNGEVYVSQKEEAADEDPATSGSDERRRSRAARERTSRFHAGSGHPRHAYDPKAAPYLAQDWGRHHKSLFQNLEYSVGFHHAPAAAKLDVSARLIGETMVSRTWRYQGSRPVVVDDVLYDTTGDRLEARDLKSGELKWQWQDAEANPGERRLTPPAVANGRVWAGTWDGRVVSWDARTGDLLWAIDVGSPCHWQPAVWHGGVYAGLEDGTLVAIRTGDPRDTSWPMWGGGSGHNGTQ